MCRNAKNSASFLARAYFEITKPVARATQITRDLYLSLIDGSMLLATCRSPFVFRD